MGATSAGRAIQSFGVIPDQSGQILQPIVNLQSFFGGTTNISATRLTSVANATSPEHVVGVGHVFRFCNSDSGLRNGAKP